MSKAMLGRGRVVYGKGSYAPNRGAVSAEGSKGYMLRSLRQDKGGSNLVRRGDSQTRSGVAAAALRRMQKGPGRPVISKAKPAAPVNKAPIRSTPKPIPGATATVNPGPPQIPQNVPTGGQVTPTVPTVQINGAGQLELPYNQKFSEATLAALQQKNADLIGLQEEEQAQDLEYASAKRGLNLDYDQLQRQTLNDNAARGVAYSSAYGTAVGRNATVYQNGLSDLEMSNANFRNRTGKRRLAIQNAFNEMLRNSALQYGEEVAQDAGDLGYGVTDPATPQPQKENARGKYPVKPTPKKPTRKKPAPKKPGGKAGVRKPQPPRKPGRKPTRPSKPVRKK